MNMLSKLLVLLVLLAHSLCAADDLTGPHPRTNTQLMQFLRHRAGEQRLAYSEYGEGQFRMASYGPVSIGDTDKLLGIGDQVLTTFEQWTDEPGTFRPEQVNVERCFFFVVVPESRFDAILDAARNKGVVPRPPNADLQKLLRTFSVARVTVMSDAVFKRYNYMPSHWVARCCCSMALTSLFWSYNREPESWLVQGLGSEMERLYADRHLPLILTIEYENGSPERTGTYSWALDIKSHIKKRSEQLDPVDAVMGLDFIARTYLQYQQMWSVSQFLRAYCLHKDKHGGVYRELLLAMARDGKTGLQAVEELLQASEPKLTKAWQKWAVKQR